MRLISCNSRETNRKVKDTLNNICGFTVEESWTDSEDGCLLFERGRGSWALCDEMFVLQGMTVIAFCRILYDKSDNVCLIFLML